MKMRRAKRPPTWLPWAGMGAAGCYWLLSALVHVYAGEGATLLGGLLPAQGEDLFLRLVAVGLIMTLALLGHINCQRAHLRAQRNLREAHLLLTQMMDHSPAVIFLKDRQGRFLLANRMFEQLYGLKRHKVLGRTARDLFPPQEAEAFQASERQVLETGEMLVVDERVERPEGPKVYLSVKFPLRDGAGRITGVGVVSTDITERVQVEMALKESEELYRAVFESIPDSLVISRLEDGRCLTVNPNFCALSGFTPQEVLGKSVLDLGLYHDPQDRQRLLRALEREGEVHNLEIRFRNKSGQVVDVLVSASRLRYQGQDCLLAVARDISDQRRMEQENRSLEAQLIQAQKMEALGLLAGGVAHDFNNLLLAAQGYLSLHFQERDSQRRQEYLEKISRILERGIELVQRLLTFGRKGGGERCQVDLNQLVNEALEIMAPAIPGRVRLEKRLASGVWPLWADAGQLEQVLVNLVSNAIDAMPQGGELAVETGNVELDQDYARTHLEVRPGRYVLLKVSDTGQGMDQQTLQRIFEPFFTTKKPGKGTGLGLSTVYGIVQDHGGHLECRSQPGQGTEFLIYLPAGEEKPMEEKQEEAARPQGSQGGSETVLVVEDEPTVLDLARMVLERAGYRVLAAASGRQALQIYQERGDEIDLVLLDLGLPDLDGWSCLEELLRLDQKVRVVVASGYSAAEMEKRALEAGALRYLPKPYRLDELQDAVRQVLDQGEAD